MIDYPLNQTHFKHNVGYISLDSSTETAELPVQESHALQKLLRRIIGFDALLPDLKHLFKSTLNSGTVGLKAPRCELDMWIYIKHRSHMLIHLSEYLLSEYPGGQATAFALVLKPDGRLAIKPGPRKTSNASRRASTTTDLRLSLGALQNERSISREQSEFLGNYGPTLGSKGVNIEDFLNLLGNNKAQEEPDKGQRKEHDGSHAQCRAAVTLAVLAQTNGSVELIFTCVVSGANWTPLYDARPYIAKTPGGISMIALQYDAPITQTTGRTGRKLPPYS
ncbi:unnamed protein product [Rhizoctonia solani]|uniref:Uncharacterized protein n=1 Tax=Rhizoctonia solani TaxID=456999 RepID=A0A8H3DR00_9AGAM|nr:unnamed protein product [Rhizoctonia solani]